MTRARPDFLYRAGVGLLIASLETTPFDSYAKENPSLRELIAAAEQSNAEAQFKLAEYYSEGSIPIFQKQAIEWHKRELWE